ncbi:MAG: RNA repair domain-containing protein [Methanobacteriota archaeon]
MGAREVLNKLKWGGKNQLGSVRVTIIHRGAPGDRRVVKGDEILELGHGFMRVMSPDGEVYIPYHRVTRIEIGGRSRYEKV